MENKRENKERPKAEIEKNRQSELWNGVYDARLYSRMDISMDPEYSGRVMNMI